MISASFLSSNDIPKTLMKLNETDVDYIHVDVMDGKYVNNKTLPYNQMKHIYKYTNKRLDIHLMVQTPSKYIKKYANLNTEYISIHLDILEDIEQTISLIKSYGLKVGLVLNPNDKVETIIPYLPNIDIILVMGVTPGLGGQEFIPSTIEKLKELQVLKKEYKKLNFKISIDGGITSKIAPQVKSLCDIIVSGNYIIKHNDYQEAINSLR